MMATHVLHKPMPLLHKPSSGHVETHTETGKYLCVLCAAARALAAADVDRARTMRVRPCACAMFCLSAHSTCARVPRDRLSGATRQTLAARTPNRHCGTATGRL